MRSVTGGPISGGLPRGWVVWDGALIPDLSVAGYLARGQQVRGFCRHQYCRRTCWIDVDRLTAHHMGGLLMEEAKTLWRCNRVGGCQLVFEEDRHVMLTLAGLRALGQARPRLRCRGCKRQWEGRTETLIARLEKSGEGNGETLVTEVEAALRRPCGQCGQVSWSFEVRWKERA